jgi:hypothetical protein
MTADGKLRVEAAVIIGGIEVDITSLERGGDDSTTADLDAEDTLGTGLQTTLSGIFCDESTILNADRAGLFALFTGAKVFAEKPNGDLQLLQLDASGNLKVTGIDIDVDLTSIERGGDDSVSSDTNAKDTLGTGLQTTVSGIKSNMDTVPFADRAALFALLTASKLYARDQVTGDLRLLEVTPGGRLKVDATGTVSISGDVSIDATSIERGGDDSISADNNAKDVLGTGLQTTVSGIKSNVSTITPAQRATLFAKLVAAKMFCEDESGNLKILQCENGGLSVTLQGSPNRFYGDEVTLVSAVGAFGAANAFGFSTIAIVVTCDAGVSVEVSFDGVAVHGKINVGESFTYFPKKETSIFFRKAVAGTKFRAWAW